MVPQLQLHSSRLLSSINHLMLHHICKFKWAISYYTDPGPVEPIRLLRPWPDQFLRLSKIFRAATCSCRLEMCRPEMCRPEMCRPEMCRLEICVLVACKLSAGVTADPIPRKSDPGRIRYASDFDPTSADSIRVTGAIGFSLSTSHSELWCIHADLAKSYIYTYIYI